MVTVKVAHTLHGYDRGHRLLARAGDIGDDELEPLDRLSDLSGYLPSGETFTVYHTGFPCGRYYALAATWLDTSARRAGTVLTHTLLFPLTAAAHLPDLQALSALHRRPNSATDTAGYREVFEWKAATAEPISTTLKAADQRALITLWFAQQERPVLWVSPVPTLDVVAHLWRLLGADERAQLAFCTYALQVRRLAGQAFGFLHVPAAARAGFHELADSVAWCDDGRLMHPTAVQASQDPFVDRMVRDPVAVLDGIRDWCHRNGLTMPPAPDVPAAHRVLELEMPAKQRLAAARSRADLITRVWPRVTWEHRVRKDAIDILSGLLAGAPMAPRPMWELRDFLARPEVQARAAADSEFSRRVASLVVTELSRRLMANLEQSLSDTIEWILDPPVPVRDVPLLPTLRSALRSSAASGTPTSVIRAQKILAAAVRRQHRPLAELAFEALTPTERRRAVLDVLGEMTADDAAEVRSFLDKVATGLHDAMVVFTIASADNAPLEALRLAERAAAGATDGPIRALEPLRAQVSSSVWIKWATRVEDDHVGRWAAAHVAEVPPLTLEEVAVLCDKEPFGARVFAEYANRRSGDELRATFANHPLLAQALVAYALGDAAAGSMAGHAFEAHAASNYLVPSVLAALARTDYTSAQPLLDRLGPAWLEQIAGGRLGPEVTGTWLAAAPLRTWIEQRLSPWQGSHFTVTRFAERIELTAILAVTRSALVELGGVSDWCYALILPSLRQANADQIAAGANDLRSLITAPWLGRGSSSFASEILERIRRLDRTPNVPSLVVAAFCAMYSDLTAGRDDRFRHTSWWHSAFWSWDRAKVWRHWLVDTWIKQRWPPAMLVEATESAPGLWGQLRSRAEATRDGKDFWKLVEAFEVARTRHQ